VFRSLHLVLHKHRRAWKALDGYEQKINNVKCMVTICTTCFSIPKPHILATGCICVNSDCFPE
jgi:hypothetical protein